MIKYWQIDHSPDLNETGIPQRTTYVKTKWTGFPAHQACEFQIVQDFCRQRYGNEVEYVQGIAACLNWRVCELTEAEFSRSTPNERGGYKTETRRVELDIGGREQTAIVSDDAI